MANEEQRTGTFGAGDVTIFYRVFGRPGRTPILIIHGSNYYDSYDWIDVASALAGDREVVVPDKRGWGESTWSPSKNYSRDAFLDDMQAAIAAMKWEKPIIMGHSAAGPVIISFAVNHPEQLSKLILVDTQMNRDKAAPASTGNPLPIFPTVEAAMAQFAKLDNPPRFALDRARALEALKKVEGGYMLKRDPDNTNTIPLDQPGYTSRRPIREMWEELAMVRTPTLLIRGTRSSRYPAPVIERLTREYPHIQQAPVDSEHDVSRMAPAAMAEAVRKFVGTN
jgi:pimeloyl-ACP methyl ester carboxylesterase